MMDAGITAERAVQFVAGIDLGMGPALPGRPTEPRDELDVEAI